jgi:predicted phosphodiesterase
MQIASGRIGVVGDVHGCNRALAGLLAFLDAQGVDALWCVGDVSDGTGDLDACAASLIEHDVLTVRGNHDRWLLEGVMRGESAMHERAGLWPSSRRFLGQLPETLEFDTASGLCVLLCHGLGPDDMNRITPEDYGYALEVNDRLHELLADGRARLVLKGHTHHHAIWQVGTLTIVEAGTLLDHSDVCGVIVDLAETATVTPVRRDADSFSLEAPVAIPVEQRPEPTD